MNTALQKGQLTLRPDLSLQVALGDIALDVELGIADAYGLAQGLLADVEQLMPWFGRNDAELIRRTHGVAFLASKVTTALLNQPALSPDRRAMCDRVITHALAALAALNVEIGDTNERATQHTDRAAAADATASRQIRQ